jgi:hypothetical protein
MIIVIIVDGCRAAGNLTCLHGGICNGLNGLCECLHGYNGTTCSECSFFLFKKILSYRNKIKFKT